MELPRENLNSMLKRHWRAIFITVAVIADSLAIGGAGLAAYFLREVVLHVHPIEAYRLFGVVVYSGALLICCALVLGLYRASYHANTIHQYALALKAYFIAVPVVVASFYFLRFFELPRIFTTLFFIFVPIVFTIGRSILRVFALRMRAKGYGLERTLLVDQGEGGPFIFRRYDMLPDLGYEVVCVAYWNGTSIPLDKYHNVDIVHCDSEGDLDQLVRQRKIERVLVTTVDLHTIELPDILSVCRNTGARLKVISQESEDLLRFAYVTDIAGLPLYSPPHYKVASFRAVVKRVFDLLASSLMILLLSPVLLATALAIFIESGSPVIFRQRRSLTKGGKEIGFFKFRSMVKNADELKGNLYNQNESDGALFKIKDDPRITKVGRFIRRYSLDELPQLFNVWAGSMSLVGPRPLPLQDFERMNGSSELWFAMKGRDQVKPGITGLWQVSGRSKVGFREMVLLDFYYIENQSIFFDLEILFATIPVVLLGRGAY